MLRIKRHGLYVAAGSGLALGLFAYFWPEKRMVHSSWTTHFEPERKWDYNWDKRHYSHFNTVKPDNNNLGEKCKPTAYRHIFLIRHGQYEESAKVKSEKRLTALGRQQAELVGQRLKELNFKYTRLVNSSMVRAKQTSDIIHQNFPEVPKESCDLLKEGAPLPPEPPVENYVVSEETFFKDSPRLEAAFRKYFHRADVDQTSNSHEIIVCHGNIIRYFILRLLQLPPEGFLRLQLAHCSISWMVIFPNGDVDVAFIGDVGFLPKELMTG